MSINAEFISNSNTWNEIAFRTEFSIQLGEDQTIKMIKGMF